MYTLFVIERNSPTTARDWADLGKVDQRAGLTEVFLKVSCCRRVTVSGRRLTTAAECHVKLITAEHCYLAVTNTAFC